MCILKCRESFQSLRVLEGMNKTGKIFSIETIMNKIYYLILAVLLSLSTIQAQDTTVVFQYTIPIIDGADDVEEEDNGDMYINSTDLELINDGQDQIVGLHFKEIPLTQGQQITQAYIQFTTDETSTGNCNINIFAEAEDDASSFNASGFNLSIRTRTDTFVNWTIEPWTILDESGPSQRTPDLSLIIQEIIDRPNWLKNNNLNILIDGTGRRNAHAYEGEPQMVAKLIIEVSQTFTKGDLSNIYINELMARNSLILDENGEADDWVELYNDNNVGVMLENFYISDDPTDTTKWLFPDPIFIEPNSFVLLWLDDAPEQGSNHVPFKLSGDGETLWITQEQVNGLSILDSISFPSLPQNVSYGRATDADSSWVYFGEYSPNASNSGNSLYLNADVNFSIDGGFYPIGTTLSMSSTDPTADIRYTTDGSIPTLSSTLYNNPIALNQTAIVKAGAFKTGFISNVQKEEFYLINGDHDLPVVQVTIDPKYLWSDQEGMYITGLNGSEGFCSDEPRNWNRDWERPVSVHYFEEDGTPVFNLEAGMKIAGGCSRGFSKKPFNLFFRDSKIEYPLFQSLDISEFKRLKLRASGNDFPRTMVRDASIHSMLEDQVDIDLMGYEPVVLYLNGEYWGYYGMRELFNRHYIEAHHGVDKDSMDFLKNPYMYPEVKEGDLVHWNDLTSFIRNNSMEQLPNYDYVVNRMDIYEFMNYNIAEIYVANYDWPANNVAVWRDRNNNGKWRWMFFDVDISSGYGSWSPAVASYNMLTHATTQFGAEWPNGEPSTLFLRKLLDNTFFQREFTQRTCTVAQTIFAPDRAAHFIDSLAAKVGPEMPGMLTKFNNAPFAWQLWIDNPGGGSLSSWQNSLNEFKEFFEDRLDFVLTHYEDYFDYSGHFNLTINYDENSHGNVVFHINEMDIPYQYNGEYFNDVPIRIKAIPDQGYYFYKWLETDEMTPIISFASNTDAILTPIFLADGTTPTAELSDDSIFDIYPNPVASKLIFRYKNLGVNQFPLMVYNSIGQVVYSKNLTAHEGLQQHEINVEEWSRGIYFLKAFVDGKERSMKVIVD